MLAGSVHWERSASPVLVLGLRGLGWWLVLGAAALLLGRWLRDPHGHRRGGAHRRRVHRRRRARRADAARIAAQLAADLRAALVRLRQRHLRGVRDERTAVGRLRRPPADHRRPTAAGPGRGRGHRLRRGHLRGLAVDGHRLRRRHRPHAGRALAAVLAVRGQAHRTEAAADRRLGRPRDRRDLLPRLARRGPIGAVTSATSCSGSSTATRWTWSRGRRSPRPRRSSARSASVRWSSASRSGS